MKSFYLKAKPYLFFLILPVVIYVKAHVSFWAFMLMLAGSLFFAFKWMSYWRSLHSRPFGLRSWIYLLAWPGMDADTFLNPEIPAQAAYPYEWLSAILKTLSGLILIGISFLPALDSFPLLRGYLGLIALGLFFHFGLFHLLSLFWRSRGIQAEAILQKPLQAKDLRDFWSKRWNLAFHQLSHRYLYKPLKSKNGRAIAFYSTFLFSGLMHELVITYPAESAYGLPTLYFMLQAIGIQIQTSSWARKRDLQTGFKAWLFTISFVLIPVGFLFPPVFVERVITPWLQALVA